MASTTPLARVDGPEKVSGAALYAAEFPAPGLLHGAVVSSAIARGRIVAIDTAKASAVPGVVRVFTHQNRPRKSWFHSRHQDESAPAGTPFRPLRDATIRFSDQPVALVVAEDADAARRAAALVRVSYTPLPHRTDLEAARAQRAGRARPESSPPDPRGDAARAMRAAPLRVDHEYRIPVEHHNPMELHASTVIVAPDGALTVHDKTQGVVNTRDFVAAVFGLPKDRVRVVAPYVGGAFGSGLRPQYQLFLAVMAALALDRSVRVELTRDQMFSIGHRPETIQRVALGADVDHALRAVRHEAVAATSSYEAHSETVVDWSGLLYRCPNVALAHRLVRLDIATPSDMRAPGAATGLFALESAVDELAAAAAIDPVELRLRNYAEEDANEGKRHSSKELRAAYRLGAERFGWIRRDPAPRSMREGRELIGWGVAGGVWEALMEETHARATLTRDGRLELACATSDIGTGTRTILVQLGAESLGLDPRAVTVRLGDSSLPASPLEGGSWTAASAGSAVAAACAGVRATLVRHAARIDGSPLAGAGVDDVVFADGRIALARDPARALELGAIMREADVDHVTSERSAKRSEAVEREFSTHSHSAVFAEVRVDEQLGVVRATRLVSAVAAGRILNPVTARSQIIGSVVFGIGMALHEETLTDHRLGRFMTHNLADYHVPVHADVPEIDVIFVPERDERVNPIGVKGVGEIGVVGAAAAIANAVFHATGIRVRDLPITIDKLLAPRADAAPRRPGRG